MLSSLFLVLGKRAKFSISFCKTQSHGPENIFCSRGKWRVVQGGSRPCGLLSASHAYFFLQSFFSFTFTETNRLWAFIRPESGKGTAKGQAARSSGVISSPKAMSHFIATSLSSAFLGLLQIFSRTQQATTHLRVGLGIGSFDLTDG